MKKLVIVLAAASFALSAPFLARAVDHGGMDMEHGTVVIE